MPGDSFDVCHRGRVQRRRPCLICLDDGANNNGANNGANNGGNHFPRFPRRRKGA